MIADILRDILSAKREYIHYCKSSVSLHDLEQQITATALPRGFQQALNTRIHDASCGLIAEIKRKSPSKGVLRTDCSVSAIAKDYETGGASCISVLTETDFFNGSAQDLIEVKSSCSIPVLRKDFIIDPYQVIESRAIGADCILLIISCLSYNQAVELEEAAIENGLDVLVEVHDHDELEIAMQLKTNMIGINNRNLSTFHTDTSVTKNLAQYIPSEYTVVSESGINSANDIRDIAKYNVMCFLVGESLIKQKDIVYHTKEMSNALSSLSSTI